MVSPQKISSYLRKPYELGAEAENELRGLIQEYPYFSNAWVLLARALQNRQSPAFDQTLKQAAMYAGDRALLYQLVNIDEAEAAGDFTREPAAIAPTGQVAEKVPDPIPTELSPAAPIDTPVAEEPIETTTAVASPTETDKIASAYDEIFGVSTGENTVATEFETFDIHAAEDTEAAEPAIEAVTESPAISTYAPADEGTGAKTGAELHQEETDHEDFVLDINGHRDEEEDMGPAIQQETDQDLETATERVAEAIAETEKHRSEDEFELTLGEHLDEDDDGLITPLPVEETAEEEFELHVADTLAQTAEIKTEVAATAPLVEEEAETMQPIAFKLGAKETEPASQELETGESMLVTPGTFFEWLAQLKKLQGSNEKKNDPVIPHASHSNEVPSVETTVVQETVNPTPSATAKSSSVDDIISRFITINPTISRPKAEFYNPAAKAKESDTPRDDLATETLAKIYRSQHLYGRAIEVYEKLIRLHPAKAAEYTAIINELQNEME